MSITDVLGRTALRRAIANRQGTTVLDVSGVAPGSYLVQVIDGEAGVVLNEKLLIAR